MESCQPRLAQSLGLKVRFFSFSPLLRGKREVGTGRLRLHGHSALDSAIDTSKRNPSTQEDGHGTG